MSPQGMVPWGLFLCWICSQCLDRSEDADQVLAAGPRFATTHPSVDQLYWLRKPDGALPIYDNREVRVGLHSSWTRNLSG